MTSTRSLQDAAPFTGYSPQQARPLGGYAVLITTFVLTSGSFALWLRRSGRPIPDAVSASDLALVAVATHKASRLVTRDRVTSVVRAPFTRYQDDATAAEVNETARGSGLRRAIGEALVCPYCMDLWIGGALTAGLLVVPRLVRWVAFALTVLTLADFLQIAYRKAEDAV